MSHGAKTLTPTEEGRLYLTDYPAWCEYIAPTWLAMFAMLGSDNFATASQELWETAKPRLQFAIQSLAVQKLKSLDGGVKKTFWNTLPAALKAAIRAFAAEQSKRVGA